MSEEWAQIPLEPGATANQYYSSAGPMAPWAGWSAALLIGVVPRQTFRFSGGQYWRANWVDSDHLLVSAALASRVSVDTNRTAPAGAAYLAVSWEGGAPDPRLELLLDPPPLGVAQ